MISNEHSGSGIGNLDIFVLTESHHNDNDDMQRVRSNQASKHTQNEETVLIGCFCQRNRSTVLLLAYNVIVVRLCQYFLSPYLSRSLADRWGTTVDFTTSFLHFSQFLAFHSMIFHSRPVHSLMLSSHRFLCLPLRLPPWTVPCQYKTVEISDSWSGMLVQNRCVTHVPDLAMLGQSEWKDSGLNWFWQWLVLFKTPMTLFHTQAIFTELHLKILQQQI